MVQPPVAYLYGNSYASPLSRLNPGQHRLLQRHVERAVETLREADRLLRGAVGGMVDRCVAVIQEEFAAINREEERIVRYELAALPPRLVPYLENPFAQAVAFNLHCERTGESHTQGQKGWEGGAAAVTARNLVFLPPVFAGLWESGELDKTRLVAIANRNLTSKAYLEVADLVRTRRKEDVDERLLRMPPGSLQAGRRGPGEAMLAAQANGWLERFRSVEIPEELVAEAQRTAPAPPAPAASEAPPSDVPAPPVPAESPAQAAQRALRAGVGGAQLAPEVVEALEVSPAPQVLVERYLTAHRRSKDADPAVVTKTLFFAHAGPMQRLVSDDKLLLRHFRPVKTQKRGQLFYHVLEVIEEALMEKAHLPGLESRGLTEEEAMAAVRRILVGLNQDPNRFLTVPDDWLGEVTRRHLYFGSRTRKEGAAYKWFRKIGSRFYLGAHKTQEEVDARTARRAARLAAKGAAGGTALAEEMDDGDDEDEPADDEGDEAA